jgi:hypothetical protein
MAKVTITNLDSRSSAKDHSSITPLHKPGSKPGPGQAYTKQPTNSLDKAYNSKEM